MERKVMISGAETPLRSTGATPIIYKQAFNRDFFKDFGEVMKLALASQEDGSNETEVGVAMLSNAALFQHYLYAYAKNANNNLPSFDEWISGIDELPIFDYVADLVELMMASISTKKN